MMYFSHSTCLSKLAFSGAERLYSDRFSCESANWKWPETCLQYSGIRLVKMLHFVQALAHIIEFLLQNGIQIFSDASVCLKSPALFDSVPCVLMLWNRSGFNPRHFQYMVFSLEVFCATILFMCENIDVDHSLSEEVLSHISSPACFWSVRTFPSSSWYFFLDSFYVSNVFVSFFYLRERQKPFYF